MPFAATWVDLETVMPSEVIQRREISYTSCKWTLKRNDIDELTYKTSAVFLLLPGPWPQTP